jgi:hypothetical protein
MSYDGSVSIVVHVDLHTFEPVIEVSQIPLYLGVAGELVAREVGVVGAIAEVVGKGQVFIHWFSHGGVVVLLVEQI